jgi:GDPmannose 4,6-dehydratase
MRALVTGITGQDGPYLAAHLAEAGWDVCGMVRGQPRPDWDEVLTLVPGLTLAEGDLLDQGSLIRVLAETGPDVVFNLAALSFVPLSFRQPVLTTEVTGTGVIRLLEAVRTVNPAIRLVQASSSEMFGNAAESPQHELTRFCPASPYAAAKALAHNAVAVYRDSYDLHASTAIMFNHESPRRGAEFVTRKITLAVAAIAGGRTDSLTLGRTDTLRDWGWAPEYMAALPLIAARDEPDDFVLATGESHTVLEFARAAFATAGLDAEWHLRTDGALFRPAEVMALEGDPSKAREVLGWKASVPFAEIARRMVLHDLGES